MPRFVLPALFLVWLCGCEEIPRTDAARLARIRLIAAEFAKTCPDVVQVDAEAVVKLRATHPRELVIVDVREAEEREVSTLPGAVSKATFEANAEAWKGRPIVIYCTVGYRSGLYAETLQADGYTVSNLAGGILAWLHAGNEVVNPAGAPSRYVHVYGATWALAPEAYTSIW